MQHSNAVFLRLSLFYWVFFYSCELPVFFYCTVLGKTPRLGESKINILRDRVETNGLIQMEDGGGRGRVV